MMTRIDTIPQEATDLAVHVALCAQRHSETTKRLDEMRNEIAKLREELHRIGIWVVLAASGVSATPYIVSALPSIRRAIGL